MPKKFQTAVYAGNNFYACNQTAQALSVGLSTTYTGLMLSNPITSKKNLVLTSVGVALSAAPAAIDPIFIITGSNSSTNVTHTTPATVASAFIGATTPASVGNVDTAATLPTAPVYTLPIWSGFTAAALPASSPSVIFLNGSLIIPPGAYAGIGATSAATGFFSLNWNEVAINNASGF